MTGEGLRARLRRGDRLVGTTLSMPGAAFAELAAAPWDLVWVDLEHGALGIGELRDVVVGVTAAGSSALARIPADDTGRITPALDCGVAGIVVPNLESAEQARDVVRRLRYPPDGDRGYGRRRVATADRHRAAGDPQADRPLCLVQIETVAGVRDCAAIAAVDGVDGIVVGTADLSFALGTPLDVTSPEMIDALRRVHDAAAASGTPFGLAGGFAPGTLDPELEAAARLLVIGTDLALCAAAFDASAARWRAAAPDGQGDTPWPRT